MLDPQATVAVQAVRAEAQAEAKTEVSASGTQRDPDPSRFIGLSDKPVASRAKGTIAGWEPGTEFSLENGQVCKVLKGKMRLPTPLESPEILVVPGIAGRWFLQVDPELPKARVYRIDWPRDSPADSVRPTPGRIRAHRPSGGAEIGRFALLATPTGAVGVRKQGPSAWHASCIAH